MSKKFLAALAVVGFATSAMAAWVVNADGTGFVGKGDVQLVYGWNNAQLQINATAVQFRTVKNTVTERGWVCQRFNSQGTEFLQERERTTTTSTAGLLSSIGRLKNQITGFNLLGFNGDPTVTSKTEGQPLNSCPAAPSTWTLLTPAGDPLVIESESSSALDVSINGTIWHTLPPSP